MKDEKNYVLNFRKKFHGGKPPQNINKILRKILKIRKKI